MASLLDWRSALSTVSFLLLVGLQPVPAAADTGGPVCESDPDCRAACRADANETFGDCLAGGHPWAACQERRKAQFQACVASRCSPIPVCEERCRAHGAGLLRACLAQGVAVEECRRQADDAVASCIAECQTCACPDVWAPVCGADGNSYGNACEARCAHTEIVHPGVCEPACPPLDCRPPDCPAGFKKGADGCPLCECREPCVCPHVYDPVCGEDGRTYGNACEARCADTGIAHEGDCAMDCQGNADCAAGEVCYPPSRVCQPACEIACLRPDPVCGHDGVTYGCGAEDAFCHGAEVLHPGECAPRCLGDQDCGPGEHCNAADICLPPVGCTPGVDCPAICTGFCQDCPCPDIYDPVCGTDGVSYENECRATCGGAGVAFPGLCD